MDVLTGTFTIVARCQATGELGVATSTAIPAGGAICPFVTRYGALSTQSFNNFYFGIDGQRLLAEGLPARSVCDVLLRTDPQREMRQLLVVDAGGGSWAFTGRECVASHGHRTGDGFAIAGNMLSGELVLDAMADAFCGASNLELTDRLMVALEAGQSKGGDKRGKQSAALKVAGSGSEVPICDLRVDEHPSPVAELRRILEIARRQLFPFLRSMPTRTRPEAMLTAELSHYLQRSVEDR
ncbi:DUF1028 domain-containing protein [Mesorhizobium comanense]|uniref:DUF1028 domain-containing protein n=1 Tax=Mesorhizobium comanense TaxID=2502215 RepID=UPI00148546EB|nr:DUF1028 domain-containing protein [Mesorhizobium comanense]